MSNLFKPSFWFNIRPDALLPVFEKGLIAFIVILAILFGIFKFLKKIKKGAYTKIYEALASLFFTNTLIGIFLYFFAYEMVPLLSARFWFLIWGIEMAVWMFFIIRKLIEIPKIKEQIQKEKEFKKYIP